MKSMQIQPASKVLYLKRNAMGLLAHMLIEKHDSLVERNQSAEVDKAFDSLSACLFGHRVEEDDGARYFKFLRETLNPLAHPEMLQELDCAFITVSELYLA